VILIYVIAFPPDAAKVTIRQDIINQRYVKDWNAMFAIILGSSDMPEYIDHSREG
jgi:hypothetical protein